MSQRIEVFEKLVSKIFIAPGCTGRIEGVKVLAKEVSVNNPNDLRPCIKCFFEGKELCFSTIRDNKLKITITKQLPTRPCCFGNDPENLSNKTLYFVKE